MRVKTLTLFFLFFALVVFSQKKAIAWGPLTHMTILDDVIKDPGLNADVKRVLQENIKYAKGGATGPDMYYFIDKRYADIAHYCSPGDFTRKMLEMAKKDGDPKKIAFAYGWMIHVATDPMGHQWVNSLAGGEYDPENSAIKSAHNNIEQSMDKRNLLDHAEKLIDPITGKVLLYSYNMDIDSPDSFNFKVFSNYFHCRENAPIADLGEVAENIAQLAYNGYPTWIMRKDGNQFNTDRYQKAYEESILEAIDGLNSAGETIKNWDLDTRQAPYDDEGRPNPSYEGYQKCEKYGKLKNCGPVTRTGPGGDHPDDTVSVGEGNLGLENVPLDSLYRLAPKKGKKLVLWLEAIQDANTEYNNLPPDAPIESRQEKLDKISALVSQLHDPSNWRDFSANNPQLFSEIEEIPDITVFENGYFEEMTNLITKNHEPVRTVSLSFTPDIIKDHPVLIIPSGGFYGLENSDFFKASLDEYVKQGGTLIVFAQQHGYEFSVLPVPREEDGSYKTIGGYGWSEDQSCFVNAAYIETWHQMLAGQSKSTPTLHLDGYFTNYPSNATVFLRRTANGQPTMLMYEYGQGQVIVTSMYSDFALKQNQASSEEIALVRDMISWAKSPDELTEIRPGETVSVSVEVNNITSSDAASVKFLIYNPDRSTILSDLVVHISIPAGQSVIIPVTYATTSTSSPGIYHIDYTLMDAQGNIIQPQAETDSGRFVVSNPPTNEYKPQDLLYSISTLREQFLLGQPVPFTVTIWNNSNYDKRLKLYWDLSHLTASFLDEVTVAAHGTLSKKYSVNIPQYGASVRLWMHFFEENGTAVRKETFVNVHGESWPYVGSCSKGITIVYPSVDAAVKLDKPLYAKGEMVAIHTSFRNRINTPWQTIAKITITDPKSTVVFEDSRTVILSPNGTVSFNSSYTLPQTSLIGTYTVKLEALYQGDFGLVLSDSTRFELPQSQISVSPNLPSGFNMGINTIPFTISNTGKINVSSGILDLTLKAPDGSIVFSGSLPFTLTVGESKTLEVLISIPSLKFGNYTLNYRQLDETRTGSPTTIVIPNNIFFEISLAKVSYRVREAANLTVDLVNTGKFSLENISVTASVIDANYTETKTISLGINPNATSLNFTIPIPESISAGWHNVNVTLTLPGGTSTTKETGFVVPESSLMLSYLGATTPRAGDTISLWIENTGGVDMIYATQKLNINDGRGIEIYRGSLTGTILSGEKKKLVEIQIPSQTVTGTAFLSVQIKDSNEVIRASFYKSFEIMGLSASLQARTDKEAYLKTDSVTGFSNIVNGPLGIENGTLNILINRLRGPGETTGEFAHFLPKRGWGSFNYPRGVAVGPDGSIYVADTGNSRIQKFDNNGYIVTSWGNFGVGDGEFDFLAEPGVGPDGSVYVVDTYNHRIQKFDGSGNFTTKWGNQGSGDGQFGYPDGIAIDRDGYVYVADTFNHRIQKFDSSGNFIMKWGRQGSGDGQFYYPDGITLGIDGSVFVTDTSNHRIQKFDSNGTFIIKWGSRGSEEGQFLWPEGITVTSDGSVYVADSGNDRIQRFDGNGVFTTKWGITGSDNGGFDSPDGIAVGPDGSVFVADSWNDRIQKFDGSGNFIIKWATNGRSDGEFKNPIGVAVGPGGSIYVADSDNYRIQKFDKSGNFITKWNNYNEAMIFPSWIAIASDGSVYLAGAYSHHILRFDSDGNFLAIWGDYGTSDGQLESPYGIAVGPDDSVYITESSGRIKRFDKNGNFITGWSFDYAMGEDFIPPLIAVGPDGSVYVVATFFHEIRKYDGNGNFITKWGNYGSDDGEFIFPRGIAVDLNGLVYVVDTSNHRIQKFDRNGNFITKWGNYGSGDGEFLRPEGIAVDLDGTLYVADTANGRIQRIMVEGAAFETLFETSYPINQPASAIQDFTTNIGLLNVTGKFSLQAKLTNNLGQTIAKSSYPFYIFEGATVLQLKTDRDIYRPGEIVTITGQIENRAPVEASGLIFSLMTGNSQQLYMTNLDIPSGSYHQFAAATTAGAEGTVTLIGKVSQNNSTLVEIKDQYQVAKSNVSVTVSVPDMVGNEPFNINVEIRNTGKVEASVQFEVQSSEFGDSQTVTLSAGEAKYLQYQQQIRQNMNYILTFTGDLDLTLTKTVYYSLAVSIAMTPQGLSPEGNMTVPVTITNTGQLAETIDINFELSPVSVQLSKSYYLPVGASTNDTLYFNLTEGNYQITASSQLPAAFAQANFSVRKENQVEMTVFLGTQIDGLIPVHVNLINIGYNEMSGSVNVSVRPSTGSEQVVWNGEAPLSQIQPQSSQLIPFNINPSAIPSGNFNLRVEFLNNSNQQISVWNSEFVVRNANFQITQLPLYQTLYPGQEAIFIFRVKNTGNQEGAFDLTLKSYDLIDSTQREWLKPGEEKLITFSCFLPEDLEEKDYFATYELQDTKTQGSKLKGEIKYRLAGINLNVNALLDKPYYKEGETAHLTINIQSTNPNPQNLFAKGNYAGYEPQQTFTLNGNQVLIFDIPLPQITGERLFYGIYHESGRSIHLNSIYIHKAGDVITITTDKQVYNPGETVSVSVSGNASGNMTLSGPGEYIETFAFLGQATKGFLLPSTMMAGTYFIQATLEASNPGTFRVTHPIDVAGILLKVLECKNDRGKYASADTILTNLIISSNINMMAILKAWIVDPTGQYTSVGEQSINLSALANSLVTLQSSLIAYVSGIHRLVYGIYAGNLLLVSGSEAFDVGDAVLLGLSTDQVDYPYRNESVIAKVSLLGSVPATLDFYLDGQLIGSQSVSLNQFSTLDYILPSVKPGLHILKAVLTAGGLTSTREATFIYGSGLPDLTLQLSKDQVIGPSSLKLTITAVNQGKSPSGATLLHLYDGEVSEGKLLASFDIPILSQGQNQPISYEFNLLGRTGMNTLYGVIDPSNTVFEFNESNNVDQTILNVPDVTLFTTLEKDLYSTGEVIPIMSLISNLSRVLLEGLLLVTEVRDQADVDVFTNTQTIAHLEAMANTTLNTNWPTDINLPDGVYTIHQAIQGKEISTQKTLTLITGGKDFTITSDTTARQVEIGEPIEYTLTFIPIKGFKGEISLEVSGYPQGASVYFNPNPVVITEDAGQSILRIIPTAPIGSGVYFIKVHATGGGIRHDLDLLLNVTDFEMILNPINQTIRQLGQATYTLTLNPIHGFNSPVTLTMGEIPKGMRAELSSNQITLPQNVTLTFETSKWLLPGEYRIPIMAKGRGITHTVTATLVIYKNPGISHGIITTPGPGPKNPALVDIFTNEMESIRRFLAFETKYGANAITADIDGDGFDEIIVSPGPDPKADAKIKVFKRDGTLMSEYKAFDTKYGATISSGDIDGDWIDEVIIGMGPDPKNPANIKVIKYQNGSFWETGLDFVAFNGLGYGVNVAVGDLDGDGLPEIIAGAGPGPDNPSRVRAFKVDVSWGVGNWRTSFILSDIVVDKTSYGVNLSSGDMDDDSIDEIIVGLGPDPKNEAIVKIIKPDGTIVREFKAYDQKHSYGVNVSIGDIEPDRPEIMTGMGPGPQNPGLLRIFNDQGELLQERLVYPDLGYGLKVSRGRTGER